MAVSTVRHSSAFKPISVPERSAVSRDNWDRVTDFTVSTNQPQEKLYELGRLAKMATDKDKLEASVSITQYEYGTMDSFLQLAGLSALPSGGLELTDFNTSRTDFISPGKDSYGGTLEQTLWVERLSLDSLSVSINADERIERSFELSGNYCKITREGNVYVIFKEDDAPSGTSGNYVIDVSDPAPVENPNVSGEYILKVYRIRAGVATELAITTDYTYNNGTKEITVLAATTSDNFRIWYTAASYGTSGDPQALNDADDYYLPADNVTITIDDGTNSAVELTQLTSFSIEATLNRLGEGAIGTSENLFNDIESYDVSVTLDGYVKDYPIYEALMTQAGQSWGLIDFTLFNSLTVVVKIYQEAAKSTFLIGYKVPDVEFSDGNPANYSANSYGDSSITLNGDAVVISTTESDLAVA